MAPKNPVIEDTTLVVNSNGDLVKKLVATAVAFGVAAIAAGSAAFVQSKKTRIVETTKVEIEPIDEKTAAKTTTRVKKTTE